MAAPTTAELALRTALLEQGVDVLREQVDRLELVHLRERVKVLEEQVAQLSKKADDFEQLRQPVAVLDAQVAELKRAKEEGDKRQWQFVYIFAGAMASLLVTVVVQLVLGLVKKP